MKLSLVPLPLLSFCIGIIIVASSATSTNANTITATTTDEHHHPDKRRSSLRSGNGNGGRSSRVSSSSTNSRSLAYDLTGFKSEKLAEVRPSVSESESKSEDGGDDDTEGETPTETDDTDDNDDGIDADADVADADDDDTDGETSSTESNDTDETAQDGGVGAEGMLLLTFDPPIVFRQFSSNTCEASALLYTGKIYGISKLDEGIFCVTDDLNGGEKYSKHTVQDCSADRGGVTEMYQTCTDNTCTDCDEVTDSSGDDSAESVYTSFTEWAEVFPTEFQDHCFQQLFTLNNSNTTTSSSGDSMFDDDDSNIDVDFQFETESTDTALKYYDFIVDHSCMKEYQPTVEPAESETDAPTPEPTTEAPSPPPTPESTDTSFIPTAGTDAPTEEPTDAPSRTDEPTDVPTGEPTTGTKNDKCEAGTPLNFYIPDTTEDGVKLSICFEETLLASYDLPLAHDGPVILNSEDGVYEGVLFTSDPIPVDDDDDDTNTQKNTTIISFYNFTSQDTTNLELTESIPMASGAVLLEDGTVAILSQGNVTDNGGIYTWNPRDGAVTALTTSWGRPPIQEATPFNSPNAIIQANDGALWFTDPQYGYDFGFRPEPKAGNWVWRYDPATNTSRNMADGFDRPTGLAFSPNEEFLYVADNQQLPPRDDPPQSPQGVWSNTIYRYRVDEYFATQEPLLTDRTVFAVSSQGLFNVGLKVDSFGNVWRASDEGITIYYPTGVILGFIPIRDSEGDDDEDGGGVTNFALQEKDDTYILYVMHQTRLLKLVGTIQEFAFVAGN